MMIACLAGRKVAPMIFLLVILVISGPLLQPNSAAAFTEESTYELGLRYGHGRTCKAHEKLYFNTVLPRWGIFLTKSDNPVLGKLRFSFLVEGLVGAVQDGNSGWDIGFTPLLKISYPIGPVLGYIEGGAGMIWENIDSISYSHSFNFSPQVGAGIDIKIYKNYALSLAYRFRHTSNAGLYKENPGVNTNFFMIGLAYYY
jgi:lipid A 3-O-deacylase